MALPGEPTSSSGKEQKEILNRFSADKEAYPIKELPTTPEIGDIPPEIEKVEALAGAEITLPQPVTDDQGQVVLDNVAPQQVTVTLPLTEEEIQSALGLKVIYSLRWLAEWSKRLLKKVSQNFIYRLPALKKT